MTTPDTAEQVLALIRAAKGARTNAYAPQSGFLVGAAVCAADGRIFTGCNVENASYGLSNCAERSALFAAISAGCQPGDLTHLAVIADCDAPVSPCGACRQVMMELGGPALVVIQANLRGEIVQTTASQLLPGAFAFTRR